MQTNFSPLHFFNITWLYTCPMYSKLHTRIFFLLFSLFSLSQSLTHFVNYSCRTRFWLCSSSGSTAYKSLQYLFFFFSLFLSFSFPGFCRLRMHNKGGAPVAFVEYSVSKEKLLSLPFSSSFLLLYFLLLHHPRTRGMRRREKAKRGWKESEESVLFLFLSTLCLCWCDETNSCFTSFFSFFFSSPFLWSLILAASLGTQLQLSPSLFSLLFFFSLSPLLTHALCNPIRLEYECCNRRWMGHKNGWMDSTYTMVGLMSPTIGCTIRSKYYECTSRVCPFFIRSWRYENWVCKE